MTKLQWLIYLAGLLIFAAVCLSFAWGYRKGKESRKIDLTGLGAQEAFAYFLKHEIGRHLEDVEKTKKDLKKLENKGFMAPDIPVGLWIEVKN